MSDAISAEAPPSRVSPVIPLTIATGFFMEGFNGTILTTSLPQIARSLGVTPVEISLAVTAYILSVAVFIPISGWIADRFGARKVYCLALLTFTIGSALCGTSTSLGMLVAMRVLQGFGGAMMNPVGQLILARSFPKEQLIVAMNYMSIPGLIGPLLGPVIGGFITTYLSWHWVFFINVPIGVAGIVLTLRLIRNTPMPRPPKFDSRGFFLMGFGLAASQLVFEYVGRKVFSLGAQLGLLAAAIGFLGLYHFHARRHDNPVLDFSLFRIRTFSVSVLAGTMSRVGLLTMGFLLPLLFQVGFGMDAFHSGLLICVSTVGALFMRVGTPALLRAVGLPRVLFGNAIITGVMIFGFALFHAVTSVWILVVYLFVFGFFRSVQFSSLSALSYADLPSEVMGRGTSIAAVAQRLAQSMGIGIAATLLSISSGGGKIVESDFIVVFGVIGLLELTSLIGYWRLAPTDGMRLTGHRTRHHHPDERPEGAAEGSAN